MEKLCLEELNNNNKNTNKKNFHQTKDNLTSGTSPLSINWTFCDAKDVIPYLLHRTESMTMPKLVLMLKEFHYANRFQSCEVIQGQKYETQILPNFKGWFKFQEHAKRCFQVVAFQRQFCQRQDFMCFQRLSWYRKGKMVKNRTHGQDLKAYLVNNSKEVSFNGSRQIGFTDTDQQ